MRNFVAIKKRRNKMGHHGLHVLRSWAWATYHVQPSLPRLRFIWTGCVMDPLSLFLSPGWPWAQLWTKHLTLLCSGIRPLMGHSCCQPPRYSCNSQILCQMALPSGKQAFNIFASNVKFQPGPSSSRSTQLKSAAPLRHCVVNVNSSLLLGHICKPKSCLVHYAPLPLWVALEVQPTSKSS